MASPALYCGLAGLGCGAGVGIWQLMNMLRPDSAVQNPGSAMFISFLYVLLNIAALCCAIVAIVLGAMASGEARRAGQRPTARGRVGFLLGIVVLGVLLAVFVAGIIHAVISMQGEPVFRRERPFACLPALTALRDFFI